MSDATGAIAPIAKVPLRVIARDWGRIGVVGVGGPPAHIALLRRLSVERKGWLSAEEFEHAVAAGEPRRGARVTEKRVGRMDDVVAGEQRGEPGMPRRQICVIGDMADHSGGAENRRQQHVAHRP